MPKKERVGGLSTSDVFEERLANPENRKYMRLLLEKAKLEIYPSKNIDRQIKNCPKDTVFTVTCPPRNKGIDATLDLSEKLVTMGFQPVPHIAARQIIDERHLESTFTRLKDNDIKEILVIGGDSGKPAGKFDSSFQLLSAMNNLGFSFDRICIAGYPEPHPKIDDDALLQALRDKEKFASCTVTQMCFNAEITKNWISEIREEGIELPVQIGLSGPIDILTLMKFAKKSGVGDSAKFLTSHLNLVGGLLKPSYKPENIIYDLTPDITDPTLNIQGLLLYTFNYIDKTKEWRNEMLDYVDGVG